ncbi:MAG: hypothetical protein U9N85_14215 [Bacteroidota bacterium]|nr:hypothetical protein [Bacteroidota bacterium]
MKKNLTVLALISALLFFTGIVFKLMHWPGAAITLLVGTIVGLVYLVLYLIEGVKLLQSKTEKISGILVVITLMSILISFVFKLQHWPGAGVLVVFAHVALFLSAISMFIDAFSEKNKAKQSFKTLFALIYFILMAILVFLAFK